MNNPISSSNGFQKVPQPKKGMVESDATEKVKNSLPSHIVLNTSKGPMYLKED